jgi:serine/threonine protein kinase/Rieske Fe-S protein
MQTLSVDQLVGRTLGEYRIERLLGGGQLGAAYIAQQLSQGSTVMITTFNFAEGISAQERDQFKSRFVQEGAALVRLAHPNILPIYDFGEQFGYLYLVTGFVKRGSLGQVLKQQMRFTPKQTLDVLKQLAAGLDYAHSNGVVHGILSLSNVLMSNELTVQIAGFGLRTVLEVSRNTQNTQPQASLFSTNGIYLGSSEYISPECVLGRPADARSDIYALGVMLFELLSGTLPFRGENPLDTALKRIQQPVPSVHAVYPGIPEALDLVVSKTLERDPAKRYQRAGDSAAAFERALKLLGAADRTSTPQGLPLPLEPQLTLPPTINWLDEDALPSGKGQLMPPIVTGKAPAISLTSSTHTAPHLGTSALPSQSLLETGRSTSVQPTRTTHMMPEQEVWPHAANNQGDSMTGIDPFAWWSATAAKASQPEPGTFARKPQRQPVRLASTRGRRQTRLQGRRQVVKLIATGTAVAGIFAAGGISFARFAQSLKQTQQATSAPVPGSTTITQGNTPTTGGTPTTGTTQAPQGTPTASKSSTPQPTSAQAAQSTPTAHSAQSTPTAHPTQQPTPTAHPTQQPTPKPTPKPTPTPTPSHTGTVIGSTSQATNSAKSFTNPADSIGSLLIHLSNGNFVACERTCTHAGVSVNYDSGSGQLVCPAHGAVFDPTNGFSHVSGPGGGALAAVTIHVNGDGTITTG